MKTKGLLSFVWVCVLSGSVCVLFQSPIQMLQNILLPQKASLQLLRILAILLHSSACNFLTPGASKAVVPEHFLHVAATMPSMASGCYSPYELHDRQRGKKVFHVPHRPEYFKQFSLCFFILSEGTQEQINKNK